MNKYNTLTTCGLQFNKTSVLYDFKEEFIEMLKETFPLFEIMLQTSDDYYALDKDEFRFRISWKKYKKTFTSNLCK